MNNCCEFEYTEGGTSRGQTLIDSEIIRATLTNASFNGRITLADETLTMLANSLCSVMNQCIIDAVNGSTLSDLTVRNISLESGITLDAIVAKNIADSVCEYMTDCIVTAVENNKLTGVELDMPTLNKPSITGAITLDTDAVLSIVSQASEGILEKVAAKIEEVGLDGIELRNPSIKGADTIIDADAANIIAEAVKAAMITAVTNAIEASGLKNLSIENLSLKGTLTLDSDVSNAITKLVMDYIAANGFTDLKLNTPSIDGKITLDADAVAGLLASLNSGITDLISGEVESALTSGKLCGITMSGVEIDNSTGSNNTFTNTKLDGTTNVNGELVLNSDALTSLCTQLQDCIRAAIVEWLITREVAVADQPESTTSEELPTTVVGARTALLGQPDTFIRIGDYMIPAWKA